MTSESGANHEEVPSHFVVGEIDGVRIYTDPVTFKTDIQDDLETLQDADCVDNARVVSYE